MAISEVYVDHTGGSDSGAGTIGDPYQTLSAAFTNLPSTSNPIRINVKNTSSSNKMTSLGTLPSGRSTSKQVIIGPYESAAADTENLLYLDAGGSDTAWNQPNDDALNFNRCHFSNTAGGQFFDLDNNIHMAFCVFDGCNPEGDSAMIAYFCSFINQTGDTFKASGNSHMLHCFVSGSGETAGTPITTGNLIGNVIYWAGSRDHLARGLVIGSVIMNNSFIYDNNTHATADGNGYRMDDEHIVAFNYFENCNEAIDTENNMEFWIKSPNAFFNNTTNRFTPGSNRVNFSLPISVSDHNLTASGMPNIGSGDVTISNELASLTGNDFSPFPGTSTTYGACYGAPYQSAVGTSGRQGLHGIESGSV